MPTRAYTLVLACALLGAAPMSFKAPAGDRPAGTLGTSYYNVILPSGRIVRPIGTSVAVGMNTLGIAVSPDGRWIVTTNDDEREGNAKNKHNPAVHGGYTLTVVDAHTMRVTSVYELPKGQGGFLGIAAGRDPLRRTRTLVFASMGAGNALRIFDLSNGKLTGDTSIATPLASDPGHANDQHGFPGSIALSDSGRTAYVVNNLANSVSTIDVASRRLLSSTSVGFFPYGVAVSRNRAIVTNEGLTQYGVLGSQVYAPPFAAPTLDAQRSSSLSILPLSANGDVTAPTASIFLPLDAPLDNRLSVGGAHPTAVVTTADGQYAFVALSNLDQVEVVALSASPRVVASLDLRLFTGAPLGTQPNALALSRGGRLLYVALAGINAIAVVDTRNPLRPRAAGLIPTGWYPTALTLSPNGRFLYVGNAKGYGQDQGFTGGDFGIAQEHIVNADIDSNAIWSTVQRIDLNNVRLRQDTLAALANVRAPSAPSGDSVVPALGSLQRSTPIKHVFFILEENKTYDSMLGDLRDAHGRPYGNGDPRLISWGVGVTPNLHALAAEFGLATNEYADAEESDAGHQFASAGIASVYTEKTLLVKDSRRPLVNKNEDVEDYPRAGYIFNSLQNANLPYRDYGDLIRVSGYDEGRNPDPKADDPHFAGVDDERAPTQGLGGLYSLDVPALGALRDHVDVNYPGWNLRIRDVRRANEFIRDFGALIRGNRAPEFTYIWLPADHTGSGADIPPLPEEVADGDRALGMIVDFISHSKIWDSSAIFITPDDAQSTRDHVSLHRSYAVVVSPYARRRYIGKHHLSTASILKTEEEILGLPPLSLGDLLATDMADFFTATPELQPYQKIAVPTQTASLEGRRIASLLERTDQSGPDADVERSAALVGLSREADKLAARKNTLSAAEYHRMQVALYAQALRVVGE